MAVAHDAVSRAAGDIDTTTHTANWSWTHTPVGTPKGVVVAIIQGLASADEITTVTYGGVGLTRAVSTLNATAEVGRVYLYHVGASIPTGAQTIAVNMNAATAKQAWCYTVTAAAGQDTTVDSSNGSDLGVIANPSLTVTHTGSLASWYGVASHFYGGAAPVNTGLQAGETYAGGVDYGAASGMTYYRTGGASAASSTYGYTTLTSDDELIAAVVIKEVAAAAPATLPILVMPSGRL